jgi:hypothetical protein
MDPIASKGLQGLSNVAGELSKAGDVGKKGTPGKFEQVRMEKLQPQDQMQKIENKIENFLQTGKVDASTQPKELTMAQRVAARDGISLHQIPGAQQTAAPGKVDGVWRPQTVEPTNQSAKVAEGIKDFNAGQQRLDAIMKELQSGKHYSKEELLSLQLEVNVLTEQMQMSTKLVDSAMQSIKQVMQQQV